MGIWNLENCHMLYAFGQIQNGEDISLDLRHRFRFKNCAHSNLNGLNTADDDVDSKRRIWWRGILDAAGQKAALRTAEMMIRLKKKEE